MLYLFCGLLSGAILAAICRPLFRKEDGLESAIIEETQWDLLQRKKEVVLGNVDLDFEYKCGKLSEEDYRNIRAEMGAEAAMVFQEIDTIESSADLDALIRREVIARTKKTKAAVPTAACSCGSINPVSNKFCAECGAKLKHS